MIRVNYHHLNPLDMVASEAIGCGMFSPRLKGLVKIFAFSWAH